MAVNNKILKKFAYKKDQNGIINRYFRENGGWDTHLNNTKKFILDAAKTKEKNSCIILGSGWLLDVPIEDLIHLFNIVFLIDIVHPKQIIHKYRKYKNIKFIEADISGFIEPVYHFINNKNKIPLNQIHQYIGGDLLENTANASMVVSLNILNQLDILICDYIYRYKIYSEEEINDFRKMIQQKHIDFLPPEKSCIITDYEELNYNDSMQIVKRKALVYIDLPKNKNIKKWKWDFDLTKNYHTNYKTVFNVMAWEK